MPQFKFNLDPLLRLRKNRLLVAKKDLVDRQIAYKKIVDEREQILLDRQMAIEESQKIDDIRRVKTFSSLIANQSYKIRILEEHAQSARKEVETYENWVSELNKQLKIVEKIEEKQKQAFFKEEKMKEQKTIDAWVVEQWGRKEEFL